MPIYMTFAHFITFKYTLLKYFVENDLSLLCIDPYDPENDPDHHRNLFPHLKLDIRLVHKFS